MDRLTDEGHRGQVPVRRVGGWRISRWVTWSLWLTAATMLALAMAYAILAGRYGIRTAEGWIDARRATVEAVSRPTVVDNGLYTYLAAVRSMESAGRSLPKTTGKWFIWPPPASRLELSAGTWSEALEAVDLGTADMSCIMPLVLANRRTLELLHAAADKPYVSPLASEAVVDSNYLAQFRQLAQLGMASMLGAHREGRDADALATARDVLALGANTPQYGTLLEAAFGDVVVLVIHRRTMAVLRESRLGTRDYLAHARYARRLRDGLYPLAKSAAIQFLEAKHYAGRARKGGAAWISQHREGATSLDQSRRDWIRFRLWRPRQSLEWIEDRTARLAQASRLPRTDGTFEALAARTAADIKARNDWFAELTAWCLPLSRDDYTRLECSLALEELAALLGAYRSDHGHYPDTLDALVPEYTDALSNDPFCEEPFGYEVTGSTYQLWSPRCDQMSAESDASYHAMVTPPPPPKRPPTSGKPAKPARKPWPLRR